MSCMHLRLRDHCVFARSFSLGFSANVMYACMLFFISPRVTSPYHRLHGLFYSSLRSIYSSKPLLVLLWLLQPPFQAVCKTRRPQSGAHVTWHTSQQRRAARSSHLDSPLIVGDHDGWSCFIGLLVVSTFYVCLFSRSECATATCPCFSPSFLHIASLCGALEAG